jgi:hypothetical protein
MNTEMRTPPSLPSQANTNSGHLCACVSLAPYTPLLLPSLTAKDLFSRRTLPLSNRQTTPSSPETTVLRNRCHMC